MDVRYLGIFENPGRRLSPSLNQTFEGVQLPEVNRMEIGFPGC